MSRQLTNRVARLEAANRPDVPQGPFRIVFVEPGEPDPPEADEPGVLLVRFVAPGRVGGEGA